MALVLLFHYSGIVKEAKKTFLSQTRCFDTFKNKEPIIVLLRRMWFAQNGKKRLYCNREKISAHSTEFVCWKPVRWILTDWFPHQGAQQISVLNSTRKYFEILFAPWGSKWRTSGTHKGRQEDDFWPNTEYKTRNANPCCFKPSYAKRSLHCKSSLSNEGVWVVISC